MAGFHQVTVWWKRKLLCNTPHGAHLASDAKKYSTCFSSSTVKWVKLLTLLILEDGALGEMGESDRWEVYTNVGPLPTKSGCGKGMLVWCYTYKQ